MNICESYTRGMESKCTCFLDKTSITFYKGIFMKNTIIHPEILASATAMLNQYFPDLTAESLIEKLTVKKAEVKSDKLLTMKETAKKLTVSTMTISRMLNAGLLPRVHVSPRNVRIPEQAVEKFLQGDLK